MYNTSTPLQLYNTSFINTSQELDETSYHSIVPQIPELQTKSKCIPKKVYAFIIFILSLSCFSLLVYITVRISISVHLSGEVKSDILISGFSNFNASLQTEALNVSSPLDQKLTSQMPYQLWEQIYFEDMLS